MKAKELIEILKTVDPETEVKYNGYNAMVNAGVKTPSDWILFSFDGVLFQNGTEIQFGERLH